MKIGVVGFGYVGRAIATYFKRSHEVFIYDKYTPAYATPQHRVTINTCDLAFVAVPTVTSHDGWSCDLTEILEVFSWLAVPGCIKSTIPPGTTDEIAASSRSTVCFSPEYIGESKNHPLSQLDDCGYAIIGGEPGCVAIVSQAYTFVNNKLAIHVTDARTAELCKYMENSFLATKISFVNQFYEFSTALGVSFEALVDLWTLDQRIGGSHVAVTPERGFGGKCLPKDVRAIVARMRGFADVSLMEGVLEFNEKIRKQPTSVSNELSTSAR